MEIGNLSPLPVQRERERCGNSVMEIDDLSFASACSRERERERVACGNSAIKIIVLFCLSLSSSVFPLLLSLLKMELFSSFQEVSRATNKWERGRGEEREEKKRDRVATRWWGQLEDLHMVPKNNLRE